MADLNPQDHFESWADNKIVNFLEDHGATIAISSEGHHQIEANNYSIASTHKGEWVNIVLRAWVRGSGWKTRDWCIRRTNRGSAFMREAIDSAKLSLLDDDNDARRNYNPKS